MAIRTDAATDFMSRTTTLPTITSFTLMGWVYRAGTGSASYECVFGFGNGTSMYGLYVMSASIARFALTESSGDYAGSAITNGVWYHLAMTVSGTTGANLLGYRNGVLEITGNCATITAGTLRISAGPAGTAEWANVRVAAVKAYSAVLTANEIAQEVRYYRPIRTANLNTWLPCVHPTAASNNIDYSGVSGNMTIGGTLTVEDGPPIAWAPRHRMRPRRTVAAPSVSLVFPGLGVRHLLGR